LKAAAPSHPIGIATPTASVSLSSVLNVNSMVAV
jgi:hypothetical protein